MNTQVFLLTMYLLFKCYYSPVLGILEVMQEIYFAASTD